VDVADRAGAEAFMTEEAFHRAGMFDRTEIHRFASQLDGRQVDTVLTPGGQLFLCRWVAPSDATPDDGAPGRAGTAEDGRLIEAGTLLADDGHARIGGLAIVEAADPSAAWAAAGFPPDRGDGVLLARWRFGQALGGA
jgi:hypothetical protein